MTVARPVEQSLFPDIASDRPRGPIPGSVQGGTNADLIANIAPLYLNGHSVLDVTYGKGGWWKRYRPETFTWHDLAVDGVDFRNLPEADSSVDVVCFDPPYIPAGGQGTTTAPEYRDRFGLAPYRSQVELDALIRDGLADAARVARKWVLVKCCDYVNGRVFTLGHRFVLEVAGKLGLAVHDLIVHHTGSGPGGHNIIVPIRTRRHHSYLLVFRVAP
jgi:hypothetical protein